MTDKPEIDRIGEGLPTIREFIVADDPGVYRAVARIERPNTATSTGSPLTVQVSWAHST